MATPIQVATAQGSPEGPADAVDEPEAASESVTVDGAAVRDAQVATDERAIGEEPEKSEERPGPLIQPETLVDLLKSSDPAERLRGAEMSGRYGYQMRDEVMGALEKLVLEESESSVKAAGIRALGRLESRHALPIYVRALKDEEAEVRLVGAAALWRVPEVAATPALVKALDDIDPQVREWAANALGVSQDRRAFEPLAAHLDDASRQVIAAVLRSLSRYQGVEKQALTQVFAKVALNVKRPLSVRNEAATLLGDLARRGGAEEGGVARRALGRLLRTGHPTVRAHVARLLGEMGEREDVALLRDQLFQEKARWMREVLRVAIRRIEARVRRARAARDHESGSE